MIWLIITLAVVLVALIPYTGAMQETTRILGAKLWDETQSDVPPEMRSDAPKRIKRRGLQDELTPRAQNLRNVLMWGLMIAVFGLTTYEYAWYHGLWVFLIVLLAGAFFRVLLGFEPGHPRLVAEIRADMQRRVGLFLSDGGDPGRSAAMLFLIGRFDNLVKGLERNGKISPSTRFQIMVTKLLFHFGFLQSSQLQNAHVLRYQEEQGYRRGVRMAIWTIRIVFSLVVVGGVVLVIWGIYSLVVHPSNAFDATITKSSVEHQVDPNLVRAMIKAGSDFDTYTVSPNGAIGLMQLAPEQIRALKISDPYDPEQNIAGGVRYLRYLLDRFRGNVPLALAAYDAGEEAVTAENRIPRIEHTREYVLKVLRYYKDYRQQDSSRPLASHLQYVPPDP